MHFTVLSLCKECNSVLDLRSLRFFITVADYLNLSRAADVLHISQSALSRQIQSLEEELGIQLFDRIGKRLVLTVEGKDLLPRIAVLLDQSEQLSTRAKAMAKGQVGLLRIGATPQTIEALLSRVLVGFRERYPDIETSLVEGSNDYLLEQVEAGGAHVAIAALPDYTDLQGEELFTASLFAVMPTAAASTSSASTEIATLVHQPLLLLRKGFMTRRMFDRACAQAGLRMRCVLESDSAQTLLALAQAGYGVAVVSSTALSRAGINATLLTLDGQALTQPVHSVWNPRRYRPQMLAPFLQELKMHLKDMPYADRLRLRARSDVASSTIALP